MPQITTRFILLKNMFINYNIITKAGQKKSTVIKPTDSQLNKNLVGRILRFGIGQRQYN